MGIELIDTLDQLFDRAKRAPADGFVGDQGIANEAIRYQRELAKEKVFDRNDTDLADQLSRESLRYMYRLLFLFYIESRPELG